MLLFPLLLQAVGAVTDELCAGAVALRFQKKNEVMQSFPMLRIEVERFSIEIGCFGVVAAGISYQAEEIKCVG